MGPRMSLRKMCLSVNTPEDLAMVDAIMRQERQERMHFADKLQAILQQGLTETIKDCHCPGCEIWRIVDKHLG